MKILPPNMRFSTHTPFLQAKILILAVFVIYLAPKLEESISATHYVNVKAVANRLPHCQQIGWPGI